MYKKYQHIERFGEPDVAGIEKGKCYAFPKIDGTNASLWREENGRLGVGGRRRELNPEDHGAGLFHYAEQQENIRRYLEAHKNHRLYGEWLVPHSLRTYKKDAWKKVYIFDVCVDQPDGRMKYLPYDEYRVYLEEFGIEYLKPICTIEDGTIEDFEACLEKADALIQEGSGTGEGIIIKNYEYRNQHGKTLWAKIVTSEFKDKKLRRERNHAVDTDTIEQKIIEAYVTAAFIEKEYAKIMHDGIPNGAQVIPMLINKVFQEVIAEEMWNILKKFKNPTINFKELNAKVVQEIKKVLPELFQK